MKSSVRNSKWRTFRLHLSLIGLSLCSSLVFTAPALASKHSLVIAIDGLRGDGIENSDTPNIDQLIKGTWTSGYKGAFAHYAQTMKDAAPSSGPNHVGIMTGVTSAKSGVVGNSDVDTGNYETYPHYLTQLENFNPKLNTAYLISWGTDMQIANQADLKIDANDAKNTQNAVDIINGNFSSPNWALGTQPDAIFLFLDDVDGAGHACCFTSEDEGYRAEVSEVDSQIGQILRAIKARPNFAQEEWQIVITSDHGGRGSSHGIHDADNYTIPFLVASKEVSQGYLKGVPNNYDAAPTALAFMEAPVPSNIDGQVRGADTTPVAPVDLKQDLVTYIAFEGNYKDVSGNNLHGTIGNGSPELKNGGKFGRYVAIDGEQEFITLGNSGALDFGSETDFTLFTWYRVNGNQKGDPVIVANKDWNSGHNRGVALLANDDNGDDAGLNIASSSGDRKDFGFIDYSYNGWWLLAATFDRDGVATLYAGSPNGHLNMISGSIQDVGDLTSSFNWNIGQDGTGNYQYNLKADLDDFAMWRRALSLDEIRTIFDEGNGVELNQIFFNKQSKYLTSDFDFVSGEQYRVAITTKVSQPNCALNVNTTTLADENAYWDCIGNADAMVLNVSHVTAGSNGEKIVEATISMEKNQAALSWHSDSNNNEHNAMFSLGTSGDPVTIKFVTNPSGTRVFSAISNQSCGLEWDSTLANNQRNAKWDCAPSSDPVRFELLADPIEPPVTEPAQLIAHFPLDSSAADVSGNGYTGNIDGDIQFKTQAERQYAEFNNKSMIVMAVGDNLPELPTKAMTISTWVNTKTVDEWGGFTGILQDNGAFEKGWLLGTRAQKFSFALIGKESSRITYLLDDTTFELNKWYHVAATYDGLTMKLYVDGQLKNASETQKGNIVLPTKGWWQIGSYKDDNEDFRHHGGLDDIKLFDQALSQAEIRDLMVTTPIAMLGDYDADADIDRDDITLLMQVINQEGTGDNQNKDIDGDGMITALDVRKLISMCTRTACATE